jgi:hypothetical protein
MLIQECGIVPDERVGDPDPQENKDKDHLQRVPQWMLPDQVGPVGVLFQSGSGVGFHERWKDCFSNDEILMVLFFNVDNFFPDHVQGCLAGKERWLHQPVQPE